ncbi:MAG: GntR family transcriptional regulator [Tessaracoccus sp.]|nr:GntR family transcriptional regulator [Tessaracoccus sp.]
MADDIVDGTLAEGDQVPSINEFASFWRINPATALKGVAQLVAEGILYKQRGLARSSPTARARLLAQRRADFHQRFVGPLLAEAARLGLTPAQVIELISQEEA